jgi:hypothetical protein
MTDTRWPPLDQAWPAYDNPSSVRVLPDPPRPKPKTPIDDGARLGRRWERSRREALEEALEAACRMADDVEVFLGELGIVAPDWVREYDHLYDDAVARINRLQKLGEHL